MFSHTSNEMEPIRGKTPIIDAAYRYKMPVLQTKLEKSRTQLVTIQEIATAIDRPTEWLVRFLALKHGCSSLHKNGFYFLSGHPDVERTKEYVYEFIEEFVLCPTCRLPETVMIYSKSRGILLHRCAACGAKQPVVGKRDMIEWAIRQIEGKLA